MRTLRCSRSRALLAITLSLTTGARAVATTRTYVATDLGERRDGVDRNFPTGINNYGQVVGFGRRSGPGGGGAIERSFLWTPTGPNATGGTLIELPFSASGSDEWDQAVGINDSGQVAGFLAGGGGVMVWTPAVANGTTGSAAYVAKSPGYPVLYIAGAINDKGQVAALGSDGATPGFQPYLWSPPTTGSDGVGSVVPIGRASPGAQANAINAYGQVAGATGPAFLWTPSVTNGDAGTLTDLGVPPGRDGSWARGMNDIGQVVGSTFAVGEEGFVWCPDRPNGTSGTMSLLGGLNEVHESSASDINNLGEAVGRSYRDDPAPGGFGQAAFVWDATDGMRDLNGLLANSIGDWLLWDAAGINDHGQIAAVGVRVDEVTGFEVYHVFLLTPVAPEPATVLALALFGCRAARRWPRPARA